MGATSSRRDRGAVVLGGSSKRPRQQKKTPRPSNTAAEKTSRHRGVCYDKKRRKWLAYITADGKKRHLGCFADEGAAGAAYASACREIGRDPAGPTRSSQYRGVYWDPLTSERGCWRAQIRVGGSGKQRLGGFATELEAARAYDAAARAHGVGGRANFPAPPTRP